MKTLPVGLLSLLTLACLLGCGRQPTTGSASDEIAMSRGTNSLAVSGRDSEQRKAALLEKIRAADPDNRTIERALLNENHELGLVLSRQTNLDDIPKLMRAMLAQMDQAFPGEDHTVIAYAPTNPPRKIGTARLDARTRDMSYTPATP